MRKENVLFTDWGAHGKTSAQGELLKRMKFIIDMIEAVGEKSLTKLGERLGESRQRITYWIEHARTFCEFLTFLCKLRKLAKWSWSKLGKEMDQTLLDKE